MTRPDPTNADRQAAARDRRRAEGLTRVEVWVPPEHAQKIRDLANRLRWVPQDQKPPPG
jgi:hypothetical protein